MQPSEYRAYRDRNEPPGEQPTMIVTVKSIQ